MTLAYMNLPPFSVATNSLIPLSVPSNGHFLNLKAEPRQYLGRPGALPCCKKTDHWGMRMLGGKSTVEALSKTNDSLKPLKVILNLNPPKQHPCSAPSLFPPSLLACSSGPSLLLSIYPCNGQCFFWDQE